MARKKRWREPKRLSNQWDHPRTPQTRDLNGKSPPPDRQRLWRQNRRSESTAEAIPANAADDEDVQMRGGGKR